MDAPQSQPSIDRESVRLLAMQIGCKAAAEQLGLSYARVRQWSSRFHWLKPVNKPTQPNVTPVTLPSSVLAQYEQETKLSLAKSVTRMAKDAEQANLRHSGNVKDVAQTSSIVYGWNNSQDKGSTILNIGVLIGQTQPEPPARTELLNDSNTVIDVDLE